MTTNTDFDIELLFGDNPEPIIKEETPPEPTQETAPETPQETSQETQPDQVEATYSFLKESNILLPNEDFVFDKTEQSLEQALEQTKANLFNQAVTNLLEQLPDDGKTLLNYYLNGGKDLDKFIQVHRTDPDSIDLSSEEAQKAIIREYYSLTTKKTPEQIDKMILRTETIGDLKEEAEETLLLYKELKAQEKALLIENQKKEQQLRKQEEEQQLHLLKEAINSTISDKPRQTQAAALITNPITYDGQQTTTFNYYLRSISSNPQHLAQFLDILVDYNPKEGFDLKKFETRGATKQNRALKSLLETTAKAQPTKTQDISWIDFLK